MTRTLYWLFLVSVLMFVSGIGFVIAAGRTAKTAAPAAAQVTQAAPVANVRQLMMAMTQPSASTIWDSVSTIDSEKGIEENRPRTDEETARVAAAAATLIESAHLLTVGNRAPDKESWPKMAEALADTAKKALAAAEKKDPDAILMVGEEINVTCDNCHERYSRE